MSTLEAATWLITAAPATPVTPSQVRGLEHLAAERTVFAPAPDGWPSPLPLPAAEASVSALHALGQLPPERRDFRRPTADAYAIPSAPGPVCPPAADSPVRELVLVVDTGLSMFAWAPTVNAFAASACELPLFNDVHLVELRSQSSTSPRTSSTAGGWTSSGSAGPRRRTARRPSSSSPMPSVPPGNAG
ncbi:hypothetical protein [Streptomyces sp. MOE7]|uniref:hypothetical protein n=1 Tax=Streptomyces sp. MOE7 TaxID=1961713 RepID=UPI000A014BBC|nr:hypothetical protein [Streptomyces sp. MOE7]ARH94838.1 hypothetical protein STRMOE7_36175 [Streptomyces sp. MOE7]